MAEQMTLPHTPSPTYPSLTIHQLPARERPVYRVAHAGATVASLVELLAAVVGGSQQMQIAADLLARYESLGGIAQASVQELAQKVGGLGTARAAALKAALEEGRSPESCSVTVMITDNDQIQELNQRYSGIDKPTDVLAFESDFLDPDLEARYLGDVVISYPQAKFQAESRGHTIEAELQLLVVHGILHLLGYDHDTEANKTEMWSMQSKILRKLDITIDIEEG